MDNSSIYADIAARTGGNIYIGVVGPVRTGKSTFIKRFMETLVLPNISDDYVRERARDELPQSGSGRTIMTAEPKFVPEDAVSIELDASVHASVRLIDSVGYMIPGANGQYENGEERLVTTPWYDHEIPMRAAAEEGTRKVIREHSTIGIVVTTDGSVTELAREDYAAAEARIVAELQDIGEPFLILLNTADPAGEAAQTLAAQLREQYDAACQFAAGLGLAFQIRDDMLDVIGTQEELGKATGVDTQKNTFVKLYGLERCEELVATYTNYAIEALNAFSDTSFLEALAKSLTERRV